MAAILGAAALGSGAGGVIGTMLARLRGDRRAALPSNSITAGCCRGCAPEIPSSNDFGMQILERNSVAMFTFMGMGISHPEARCERCCRQGFGRVEELYGRDHIEWNSEAGHASGVWIVKMRIRNVD